MNKKEQAKLLTEIMEADEKDGLYELPKPKTAVEWLIEQFEKNGYIGLQVEEQAKQMEYNQMSKMYNHAMLSLLDTGHGQGFEEYYNETYKK